LLTQALGCSGWFLWNPFHEGARRGVAPPASHAELMAVMPAGQIDEQSRSDSPHVLQVFTEEDGEGGAIYYFDGHFLSESPGLAASLLPEDWGLPSGHGEGPYPPAVETSVIGPGGDGPGVTFVALLTRDSKYPLDDLPVGYRIEGVRLPDLARHLCAVTLDGRHGTLRQLPVLMLAGASPADPMEGAFIRAIQAAPGAGGHWAAWADWRQDHGREPPGITLLRDAFGRLARMPGQMQDTLHLDNDLEKACRQLLEMEGRRRAELRTAAKSLIHVEEHLAQM